MHKKILYHGSVKIITKPAFGQGKIYNDYGRGFYCTESLDLAKEWAVTEKQSGFANKYSLDLDGLKILDLSSKEYTTLHWITILLQNRIFNLKSEVSKVGKDYLIKNFSISTQDIDIIKGYRADDSYFAYATSFLNNTISLKRLSEALKLGNLGEQIVLISKRSFDKLNFLGYEVAQKEVYYPLRKARNDEARKAFLNNKAGIPLLDDLYLIDIIRGGLKSNDPRLQ